MSGSYIESAKSAGWTMLAKYAPGSDPHGRMVKLKAILRKNVFSNHCAPRQRLSVCRTLINPNSNVSSVSSDPDSYP